MHSFRFLSFLSLSFPSIHAPYTGATRLSLHRKMLFVSSIHAPIRVQLRPLSQDSNSLPVNPCTHTGATVRISSVGTTTLQSMHPCGCNVTENSTPLHSFNPCTHAGVPAATFTIRFLYPLCSFFNPCTLCGVQHHSSNIPFNPCTPYGCNFSGVLYTGQ